jgi:hypothetical protein
MFESTHPSLFPRSGSFIGAQFPHGLSAQKKACPENSRENDKIFLAILK